MQWMTIANEALSPLGLNKAQTQRGIDCVSHGAGLAASTVKLAATIHTVAVSRTAPERWLQELKNVVDTADHAIYFWNLASGAKKKVPPRVTMALGLMSAALSIVLKMKAPPSVASLIYEAATREGATGISPTDCHQQQTEA